MALMRAFHVTSTHPSGYLIVSSLFNGALGMSPFSSPSVFNFYPVDYQPYIPDLPNAFDTLVAPEMGVLNSNVAVSTPNLFRSCLGGGSGNDYRVSDSPYNATVNLDFTYELSILSSDPGNPEPQMSDFLTTSSCS